MSVLLKFFGGWLIAIFVSFLFASIHSEALSEEHTIGEQVGAMFLLSVFLMLPAVGVYLALGGLG